MFSYDSIDFLVGGFTGTAVVLGTRVSGVLGLLVSGIRACLTPKGRGVSGGVGEHHKSLLPQS